MTRTPSHPSTPTTPARDDDSVHAARMSFGDHLEDLRSCLIRALVGVVLGTALCLIFGKDILDIICRPLLRAQAAAGVPARLQVLAPTAAFMAYLKIGFLSGLVLSMPWVLAQAWRFVSSGLYSHERRFVKLLLPASLVLFGTGVSFLYFAILPIVFRFFIGFNQSFGAPSPLAVTAAEQRPASSVDGVSGDSIATGHDAGLVLPSITTVQPGDGKREPNTPDSANSASAADRNGEPARLWVNPLTRRLMVRIDNDIWSVPLEPGEQSSALQSQFAIDFYISFVLLLALAFGIAFETPIVVYFLSRTGIVPLESMVRGRKYVMLGAVVLAAILTPPDVISQLLLAGPMYLLFELGILAVRIRESRDVATS